MAARGQITTWLDEWRSGDTSALDRIMPLAYAELREVARRHLRRESSALTISPTVLVHEAYLRLLAQRRLAANDRQHFFAIAGRTMRRILVDRARARLRLKRGGYRPVALDDNAVPLFLDPPAPEEVLALDVALRRLAEKSERAVRVIECRLFAGLTLEETARALGLSDRSVQRCYGAATAWLRKEISRDDPAET